MKKEDLICYFKIKNIEDVTGKAVPMIFLTFPESIGDYPKYIFKGFEKVEIKAGEIKDVKIIVDEHALSYYDLKKNNYVRVNNGIIHAYIVENDDPKTEPKLKTKISCKY